MSLFKIVLMVALCCTIVLCLKSWRNKQQRQMYLGVCIGLIVLHSVVSVVVTWSV
jgi:hypothetical protein